MKQLYLLMIDYDQPGVERFLGGIYDVKITNPLKPSEYNIPYCFTDEKFPKEIFLNFKEDKKVEFDYRKDHGGHIVSESFLNLIENFRVYNFYKRKLFFSVSGKEKTVNNDYYLLFFSRHDFIDVENSILLPVRLGVPIPEKLVFRDEINDYDIFQLSNVVTALHLVINEKVKEVLENSQLKGFKIIPLESSLEEYCRDYHFNPDEVKLMKKPKLS